MKTLKLFFEALNREEQMFLPVLASDNLGLLMRCAINELDWYYYNYLKTTEPTEEQDEQLYILQLGTARLVQLILEARDTFDVPVVTTRRHHELSIRVLEVVSALGMIQHGRRVAQGVAFGIGNIEQTGASEFIITLPDNVEDKDFYEREILNYYYRESRHHFEQVINNDKFLKVRAEVEKKLFDLVYPFMEHYIGYDSDPILDDYFYGIALHVISHEPGYDTYHYSSEFGGIKFQKYMLALTYLVSIRLKHENFAEALIRKVPEVKLENVLTISADIDPFIESLCEAVNYFGSAYEGYEEINLSEARQIFEILSYSRKNTKLIDPPGSAFPLLIKCSETGVVCNIFGVHSEPVRFLLESLRFHYPMDYHRNQTSREDSFQRATKRVLNDVFEGLDYRENLTMRLDGATLSDLDLIILEKRTGTILLCQLKYQELYGRDLHAKGVRTERLKSEVSKWFDAVEHWQSLLGLERVMQSLRLPNDWSYQPKIYTLVIAKHFAYPLKEVLNGEGATFANWAEFYNFNQHLKTSNSKPTLLDLLTLIREIRSKLEKVTHLPEPPTKWQIKELVFTTKPESESLPTC